MTKEVYEQASDLLGWIDSLENMGRNVQSKLGNFFTAGHVYSGMREPAQYTYDIDESYGLSRATLEELEHIICKDLDSKIVKLRKELADL